MSQWGVTRTRYTEAARAAVTAGILPADVALPVSLEETVELFTREKTA